jgi:transcriptional regulator
MESSLLGTALEMLVLEVIAGGPSYGYEIAQTVAARSGGAFELKEGTLYPALHRLERRKLLKALWREADGRRRKYYELTDAGRAELTARKQSWVRFSAGINGVLGPNHAGWVAWA